MANRIRSRPYRERGSPIRLSRKILVETWLNVRRNGVYSVACIAVAGISLLVFGIFLLLDGSVNNLVRNFEERVGVSAYLKETVTPSMAAELQAKVVTWPQVEAVNYVSQEEAMDALKRDLAGFEDVLTSLMVNPLPASLEIKPKSPQVTAALVAQLKAIPEIEEVQYDAAIVDRLIAFASYFRIAGILISLLFVASTWFLLSSSIRMTVYARKEEIEIMKLVGATDSYIRYPFIIEGIFYGLVGAIIAGVLLVPVRSVLVASLQQLSFMSAMAPDSTYQIWIILVLVAVGSFLGAISANLSIRRFLHA
ncbi:MAG: permease-like cell division protein FtsX, partial [bacterium]